MIRRKTIDEDPLVEEMTDEKDLIRFQRKSFLGQSIFEA
jgi:hypothetical protein